MALPEVQVELYEKGEGPRHTFKTKLQGWDANRLDLETIQNTYRLHAMYAYSISGGRGNRLTFHPRNGLSKVCYSGKPNSLIRLDSDPKTPFLKIVYRFFLGFLIAAMLLLVFHTDLIDKFNELGGGSVGWFLALALFIASRAFGWSFRRKR